RHSFFQANNCIVISTTIKLGTGDSLVIKSKMDELNKKRREKQPLEMPSAGSVFKRPQNGYASKLIEDCGLKGYTLGGAQVSEKHSGFIVNRGGATCADVLKLIEYVQKVVEDKTGIFLEPEVKLVSLKNKG
ncbi:MAG: UDP-N-acetylenolpyruvoylglucosamine reductase, partial [Clostridiales bacterium]|nr:UDP-N-acetylenolpyruvoylglucosamine reductase [Clostridiales bacterium]